MDKIDESDDDSDDYILYSDEDKDLEQKGSINDNSIQDSDYVNIDDQLKQLNTQRPRDWGLQHDNAVHYLKYYVRPGVSRHLT